MIVKLLTEHHLEFLSLKGGSRGSSESSHVKMSNCWKSHVMAQFSILVIIFNCALFCRRTCAKRIKHNFLVSFFDGLKSTCRVHGI